MRASISVSVLSSAASGAATGFVLAPLEHAADFVERLARGGEFVAAPLRGGARVEIGHALGQLRVLRGELARPSSPPRRRRRWDPRARSSVATSIFCSLASLGSRKYGARPRPPPARPRWPSRGGDCARAARAPPARAARRPWAEVRDRFRRARARSSTIGRISSSAMTAGVRLSAAAPSMAASDSAAVSAGAFSRPSVSCSTAFISSAT